VSYNPHVATCRECGKILLIAMFSTSRPLNGRRCLVCEATAQKRSRLRSNERSRLRQREAPKPPPTEVAPLPLPTDWREHLLDAISAELDEAGFSESQVFGRKFGYTLAETNGLPTIKGMLPQLARYGIRLSSVIARAERGMGW